jgi:hypothetical protein
MSAFLEFHPVILAFANSSEWVCGGETFQQARSARAEGLGPVEGKAVRRNVPTALQSAPPFSTPYSLPSLSAPVATDGRDFRRPARDRRRGGRSAGRGDQSQRPVDRFQPA